MTPRAASIALAIALLVSAFVVAQQFAPAIEYARTWDSGHPSAAFARWSGLEPPGTGWITDCRERWTALTQSSKIE